MILVSIHDVTPALEGEVRQLWTLCRAHGIAPALLVVPDWHGRAPLEAAPRFVAWVQACARDGAELFLHGERHDEVGTPRRWRDELRAFGRTAGEGEFLALSPDEARARLTRGLARLRGVGLDPIGFVPPAWLGGEAVHRAVASARLRVSEDAAGVWVHDPLTGSQRVPAPAVRWSGRGAWRPHVSAWVAEAQWWRLARAPLVRLALHPADLAHRASARSVARTVARWAARRRVARYASVDA